MHNHTLHHVLWKSQNGFCIAKSMRVLGVATRCWYSTTNYNIRPGYLEPMQGSQNFRIPGSPSGRYSSDFGSPKISWTSPNKKDHKCQSKTFLIHKYQGKILLFTGNVPSNFVSCWAKLFSIGRIFRAPEQKHSLYQTCTAHTQKSV